MRRLASPALLLVLAAMSLNAAPARADVGERIILLCTHNKSIGGFSPSDYSRALKELSADVEEYGECAQLIRQAQEAAAAHGRGGGPSSVGAQSSAIQPTAAETAAIAHATHFNPGPVPVDGGSVRPGVIHADVSSAFSTLPTPLLVVLAVLAAGVAAFGGRFVRNRVRDGRTP